MHLIPVAQTNAPGNFALPGAFFEQLHSNLPGEIINKLKLRNQTKFISLSRQRHPHTLRSTQRPQYRHHHPLCVSCSRPHASSSPRRRLRCGRLSPRERVMARQTRRLSGTAELWNTYYRSADRSLCRHLFSLAAQCEIYSWSDCLFSAEVPPFHFFATEMSSPWQSNLTSSTASCIILLEQISPRQANNKGETLLFH